MNDFYIGYSPKAPPALGRFVERVIMVMGFVLLVVALLLVHGQMPFAKSAFEYGKLRAFEGTIEVHPYPTLRVARPGEVGPADKYSSYLIVAPGKHAADALTTDFDGRQVRLTGQLIYRAGGTMVELVPGSISLLGSPSEAAAPMVDLGAVTITGEIVDSKCYLGVMNPGKGKVHRDCAARCLSGGIPPIFVALNGGDQYLLVAADGDALGRDSLREFIAEPITLRGELWQKGDRRLLRIDSRALHHTPDRIEAALRSEE